MIDPAVLDAMLAAGCTADQIVAAVKADAQAEREREEARREAKRAGNAERQRRHRERNALSRVTGVTNGDTPSPEGSLSPEPPIFPNLQPIPPSPPKGGSSPTPRSELETVLDAERAQAVIDHRQRMRKPLTAHAAKLLAGRFAKAPDPNAAADTMIANGWQGFDAEWLAGRSASPRGHSPPPGRRMNAVEALISRRMEQANGSESRGGDSSDAELLPPDKPELRAVVGELGQALRWPVGPGDH